jgi:uncharacterized protein (TIGR03437 family)
MKSVLVILFTLNCGLFAQLNLEPVTAGSGYVLPNNFSVAPGQLLTLIVQGILLNPATDTQIVRAPAGADLPTTLAGLSAGYLQGVSRSAPILEMHPFFTCQEVATFQITCGFLVALTIQIPYEAQSELPIPPSPAAGIPDGTLTVYQNGMAATGNEVTVLGDQVHIITTCDIFMNSSTYAGSNGTGLPCPSTVTHANGSMVSATSPAKAGEELIAYAVGLGQTNPASVTGQLVIQSAPTLTAFALDYNYHPNALPSRPLPTGPQPVFAGTTPGYVGLYQINFVVPPVPAGTPPCVDTSMLQPPYNVVQSNLTVSVGGQFSFDGARICVAAQ